MRILLVHNQYLFRGGEDESHAAEVHLLQQQGEQVEQYVEHNRRIAELGPVRAGIRTVWSQETYRRIRRHVSETSYDVLHVQNFFPLVSPAVYYAARAEGLPTVQSLRNYRLLCPNGVFFRNGQACEDCLGKALLWPGVIHACYRENRAASGTVAAMLTIHRLLRTWTKMVDIYVALTEFTRQKYIQGGLPAEKIVVRPNFVHLDTGPGEGRGRYALFVGRLSPEKGIDTLLAAWKRIGAKAVPLKIVGDGPLAAQVAEEARRASGVEWLGRKSLEEVYALMGEAAFLVFPSEFYETFGRVAIEAFAKGTPVIASEIGAVAEVVEHGRTGLHFRPGDPESLIEQVEWALAHPHKLAQMRREARAEFEAKYTAERNYRRLMEIYERAIAGARRRLH